ncbi:uncharacterized protein LOC130371215 isoform X1 [Gadus chalcogrammus]|uniref:uncharacterized protein LOC130371215 isoform X1 n=2 Tax=Gadus chalcogrammus TaxID=1042646 RepID=UPI0024C4C35E|nr:uncharacterized protein LOC130371215 isoform X1 [Gadus chalcogrammus]XP_056432891.1 uncharacterized protein LOC130371215 isoform X1 [Gadus chalcogrammus]XP_056432892.1 uncharacterized protein LOC130371215 isoform X1 [Gadus chalcogrammus]
MDISESTLRDQLEISSSSFTDSSSCTEEELSVFEIKTVQPFSLSLESSDEEDQPAEANKKVKRTRKPPSKTIEAMDKAANGSNPQQRHIDVKMSSNTEHQRIYDKKNYCFYCEKPFAKITRHLKQKHSEEVEVAKALAHRQGSTMHILLLGKIRNMGNYNHNCSVLSSGNGQIIPKRQATYPTTATDYLPCKFCFAMYVRKDLWRHHKRCKLQVESNGPVKRKVQTSCSLMLPMDTTISSGLKEILQDMTYDIVTQVVKSDYLILSLGDRMFLKNGEVQRHRADIRNKLRELARLVLMARKIDKDIISLKDLINPGKFNTVLEAVKNMTGFDALTNRFSAPSTALKLRHSLVKVSYIVQGEALRQQDNVLNERAEQFVKLIELEWTKDLSSNALQTLSENKWNSPEDIKKLQDHLKTLAELYKKALIVHPSQGSWSELSQVTLTQLILFNRCCEGEVSRMEVTTYLQRNKSSMHDEILKSLSPFEKKLCENFIRVEIRGKRGQTVPVLFPTDVQESVELLIRTRDDVGISPSNPYIFSHPHYGSQGNMRGCECLKRYAESCGAQHPENITSTKLRKHVATVSQLLNLQTRELDQLATFMGHDVEIHREFYRLPGETLHVAKVSNILHALQDGMGQFKEESLEDITPNINYEEEFSNFDAEDVQSEQTATTSQEGNSEDEYSDEFAAISRQAIGDIQKSSQKAKPRRPLSETERQAVEHHFKDFLMQMKIPGKTDCQGFLNGNPRLRDRGRDWKVVKYFMHNKIMSLKRKLCQ